MDKNVIEIKDVSFRYQEDASLSLAHVDLQVREGEVIVLCGASGCGKSTLLRLINGLIPFYYHGQLEGEAAVFGLSTAKCSIYDLGTLVSTVFQNPKSQFFCVDVISELAFAAENLKYEKQEIENRIQRVSQELACEHLLDRTMFQLSGGEKQKIACASVSVTDNPIIVLDEPSANLDLYAIEELKKTIQYWKQKGKTIVIAEHRLQYLQEIATRFLYMKHGKIICEFGYGEIQKLTPKEIMDMGLRCLSYDNLTVQNQKEAKTFMTLRDFCFRYKGSKKPNLSIKECDIPKAAVIAIVGKNGAGKSTFVRCFCGLEKKAKGFLEDEGEKYKASKRLASSFLVMQDVNHQLFTESVEEEILLSMKEKNEALLESLLKEFDLPEFRGRHPMSLSGGQKQRVAIACAIASQRNYIFFDEPTSGLDYFHMKQVSDCILDLQKKGKTIFLITHDIELIYACCNYVLQIEEGKIKELQKIKNKIYPCSKDSLDHSIYHGIYYL